MNFIKNHYEKILCGLVLIGLTVAVVLLPVKITQEKNELKEKIETVIRVPSKPLTNLDETAYLQPVQRLEKSIKFEYTKTHNLFNPVPWQRRPDNSLIPLRNGNEVGPEALQVTGIHPLFTTIAFESVGASGSNYLVSITRDAELLAVKRRKKSVFVEVGVKNEFSTLIEAKAKPDAPEKPELTLKLNDTGEAVTISAEKPFRRVDGYNADLKYDPEKKVWATRRAGDKVQFGGDEFTVITINQVATNQFEVIVSARSTGKKYLRVFSDAGAP